MEFSRAAKYILFAQLISHLNNQLVVEIITTHLQVVDVIILPTTTWWWQINKFINPAPGGHFHENTEFVQKMHI